MLKNALGCSAQFQTSLEFFGQNTDDLGKSTREKGQACKVLSLTFHLPNRVKVK